MESACSWLRRTLESKDPYPLQVIHERHVNNDDSFSLSEVLSFLPETNLSHILELTKQRLTLTLASVKTGRHENELETGSSQSNNLRGATELAWLLATERKDALPTLRALIFILHDAFFELPEDCREKVSSVCEILWHSGDLERNRVAPCAMLYLLQRSFENESDVRSRKKHGRSSGAVVNVRRVYAFRRALETLELVETSPQAETIRSLLLRCATSSAYLKIAEGRRFLAHLLTMNELKEAIFDALTNHLGRVRKHTANLFGAVFLHAWKLKREEWLAKKLMTLSEKAIQAGCEPYSTNLRVLLSNFHANKRVAGVDLLLSDIYSPVLYRNLMVANPLVRRNAVIVLSDAFPIHDPGAGVEEIQTTIATQCSKLLSLIQDPCCVVRLAAIEGCCRVLGLFWELVPVTFAKRVVDILTSQMALDASSSRVRVAVFEGLKFMLENHLSHHVLALTLSRLRSLIHDRIERVRLAFLDLLVAIKRKRIVSIRYFDIVEISDLLLRLPRESPAVATKIMALIRTSYFPLERKQKTAEEMAASQVRACLSLLDSNRESARYFYSHLYLHVAPGPLLEFAMQLSSIAIIAPSRTSSRGVSQQNSEQNTNRHYRSKKKSGPEIRILGESDENKILLDRNDESRDRDGHSDGISSNPVDQEAVLTTVAEVLTSISLSLRKDANREMQIYLENIFGGEALWPLLLEKRNSLPTRIACWRIASCLPASRVEPLAKLWQKQMSSITEIYPCAASNLHSQRELISALLLCGLKWDLHPSMSHLFASWCDASISGNRAASLGVKTPRRNRKSKKNDDNDNLHCVMSTKEDMFTRAKFLFSLWLCGDVILRSEILQEEFMRSATACSEANEVLDSSYILAPLQKACIGVLDYYLEIPHHFTRGKELDTFLGPRFLVQVLTTTWRASLKFATRDNEDAVRESKQLTEHFSSNQVWNRAFAIDQRFGMALASICLAHCADAAAVIDLSIQDITAYREMFACIRREMIDSGILEMDKAISATIRLSVLLRERAADTDPSTKIAEPCRALELKKTSNILLSMVCEILSSVKLDSDESRIELLKTVRYENFFRDLAVDLSNSENEDDFRLSFSKGLMEGFKTASMARRGLFSGLICKIVASLIMSNAKGRPLVGFKLFHSIMKCYQDISDAGNGQHCLQNFAREIVETVSLQCIDCDDQKALGDDTRECLAMISEAMEEKFIKTNCSLEEDAKEMIAETRRALVLLCNAGERDVTANEKEVVDPT